MKQGIKVQLVGLVCALALCIALPACASGASGSLSDEAKANSTYMTQVNETVAEFNESLDSFIDAVSRDDVVNMRTQADNAYASLDKLSKIEPPEGLSEIHKKYVDGSKKLEEALDAYIQLYTEAKQDGKSFDWSGYDSRMKEIQALYDSGVELIEQADKAAVEYKG